MKLALIRRGPALIAADQQTADYIAGLKMGEGVTGEFRKARNIRFHRRLFALLQFAFSYWEPIASEYKGQPVAKEFDRFRKDVLILSGFGRPVYNVRGEVRMEAESLSFSAMDDARFAEVYKAILDTVWRHIMSKSGFLTVEDVDNAVNELMSYE